MVDMKRWEIETFITWRLTLDQGRATFFHEGQIYYALYLNVKSMMPRIGRARPGWTNV